MRHPPRPPGPPASLIVQCVSFLIWEATLTEINFTTPSIRRRFLQLFAYLRGMVYYWLPCLISLCEAIGGGLFAGAVVCGGVSLAIVTIVCLTNTT